MRYSALPVGLLAAVLLLPGATVSAADDKPLSDNDLLIADFEGEDYGDWTVEGEAFGTRPAVANVQPRNQVIGHWGKGLVNSYLGGDMPHGKLTSRPFTIERPLRQLPYWGRQS